jgi:hypothetical protein
VKLSISIENVLNLSHADMSWFQHTVSVCPCKPGTLVKWWSQEFDSKRGVGLIVSQDCHTVTVLWSKS